VIVAVPDALGVNVTEQLPLTRVQLVALNEPATPALVKLTVPVGVVVGAGEESATVAVHREPWLTTTGEAHETPVVVCRKLTVREPEPLLVL